ncbi:interleukin 17a/f2 [Trichomycterus rosablanca]|uniref:interleukin 17a/f2 n=1 Tax=Trichomycterus rosablanca TaxID=2290929 RepID=UPI002F35CAB0
MESHSDPHYPPSLCSGVDQLAEGVVLCCGLLMFRIINAESGETRICGVKFSQNFHSGSERTSGNGNINNRSLSSWNWISHQNSNRIPRVIFEAECQQQYCSSSSSYQQRELNSVPIYRHILVLVPDRQNRTCFHVSVRRVAVGCACAWAQAST